MNFRSLANATLNRFERLSKRERLSSFPTIMQLELSAACNLSCSICARAEFPYGPGNLPVAVVRSLAPLFPYLRKLILHGYGEPLAHPRFVEIMDVVAPFSCEKSFYTNGTLLSGRKAEAVIAGRISGMTVSIDSPRRPSFERIRTGASFDRVVGNLGRFVRMRDGLKLTEPRVTIAAVAMKDNVDDLPALVDLAAELGADAVEVNYLMAYRKSLVAKSLYFDRDRANAALREVRRRGRAKGIDVQLPALFAAGGRSSAPRAQRSCPRPYDFTYIGYDGNVRPCCFPLLYLGTVTEADFSEIWNGSGYRGLRRALAEGKPPEFCRACLSGVYTHVDSELCHISCEWR